MREDYTEEQAKAISELILDYVGGHWQTGQADGCLLLWVKMGPRDTPQSFHIDRSGTVTSG